VTSIDISPQDSLALPLNNSSRYSTLWSTTHSQKAEIDDKV
jgi:hypothetical protein